MISLQSEVIKVLEERELNSGKLYSILEFINTHNSQYIQLLCTAKDLIPTPGLLKQLYNFNIKVFEENSKLLRTFNNLHRASEQFYHNLIKLVFNSYLTNKEFEKQFELYIQPYGQLVINYLKLLKHQIEYIKLIKPYLFRRYSECDPKESLLCIKKGNKLSKLKSYIVIIGKLYKLTPKAYNRSYVIGAWTTTVLTVFTSFVLSGGASSIAKSLLQASAIGLAMIVTSIANYKNYAFNLKDVAGKNVLSNYYKMQINKMYLELKK